MQQLSSFGSGFLFIGLKLHVTTHPLLLCDNISAQNLAHNLVLHPCSKYIELD